MSRRYGRNQKRAHRARIAELEAAHVLDRQLLAHQAAQLGRARYEIDTARRILGDGHAAFEPSNISLRELAEQWSDRPLQIFIDGSKVADCYQLRIDSKNELMRLARHFRVRFGNDEWHYALSLEAVAITPKEILAHRIARELAEFIVLDLKCRKRAA